jgi:hypothetical protein
MMVEASPRVPRMFDVRMKAVSLDPALLRIVGAAVVATVAVMSIGAGALALTGRSELKTLRLEVAAARDEAAAARQRSASLEQQLDAVSQKLDEQAFAASRQPPVNPVTEKQGERAAFRLTQEEKQLVRSYIKASPASSDAAATISVGGDLRHMPLLPLPPQIVGRAPRLAGGRFTVDRNGAIVITLRNSQMADAVIQPN